MYKSSKFPSTIAGSQWKSNINKLINNNISTFARNIEAYIIRNNLKDQKVICLVSWTKLGKDQ